MVKLVLSSKLLTQVETANRINSTYENSRVEVNIIIYVENGSCGHLKLFLKVTYIPDFTPIFSYNGMVIPLSRLVFKFT